MKAYIYVLIAVTVLSAWAVFDPQVAVQRDELIPKLNFEPFVYLLYLVTGISIFVRATPARVSEISSIFLLPFSAAFTGWGLGITISELIKLNFKNVAVGLLLTALMAIVTLAPVVQSWLWVNLVQDVRGRWFAPKSRLRLVHAVSVGFIVLGFFGLLSWAKG